MFQHHVRRAVRVDQDISVQSRRAGGEIDKRRELVIQFVNGIDIKEQVLSNTCSCTGVNHRAIKENVSLRSLDQDGSRLSVLFSGLVEGGGSQAAVRQH